RDAEQESVRPRSSPRLRLMGFSRIRLGEGFRLAAIGRLPPDGAVAVAIGLKRDVLVRDPHRKTVVSSGRECLHRGPAGPVTHPDDRLFVIFFPKDDPLTVWRHPGRRVWAC